MMTLVWDKATDVKRADLLVLLSLADWANDDGVCWPSIERLGSRARINRRNTYNALTRLEEAGWISRTSREGRSTIYTVHQPVSEKTHPEPESVASDIRGGVSVSLATDVAQDTPTPESAQGGVAQDTPGVSQATGGGVAQDTQNPKEPSVEPSSSSGGTSQKVVTGGWQPRWSPSPETVRKVSVRYPQFSVMDLKMIADDLFAYCERTKNGTPNDSRYEMWVKNEHERLAKIEREEQAEARAAREPERKKPDWLNVAE